MSGFMKMALSVGIVVVLAVGIVQGGEMQWERGRVAGERLMQRELEKEQARQATEHAAFVSSVNLLSKMFNQESGVCNIAADGSCVLNEGVWKKHRIQFTHGNIEFGSRTYRIKRNADGQIIDVEPHRSSSITAITLRR